MKRKDSMSKDYIKPLEFYGATMGMTSEAIEQMLEQLKADLKEGKLILAVILCNFREEQHPKQKEPERTLPEDLKPTEEEAEAQRKEKARRKAAQDKARALAANIARLRAEKEGSNPSH